MKKITLSLPEDLLSRSREYAEKHGSSLNELIRTLLRPVVNPPEQDPIQKLINHSQRLSINTRDWKWDRSALYDREILLDLLRWDHLGLKTALFHPLFTFFSSQNRAMLLKKGYDWVKNSSVFPPS